MNRRRGRKLDRMTLYGRVSQAYKYDGTETPQGSSAGHRHSRGARRRISCELTQRAPRVIRGMIPQLQLAKMIKSLTWTFAAKISKPLTSRSRITSARPRAGVGATVRCGRAAHRVATDFASAATSLWPSWSTSNPKSQKSRWLVNFPSPV